MGSRFELTVKQNPAIDGQHRHGVGLLARNRNFTIDTWTHSERLHRKVFHIRDHLLKVNLTTSKSIPCRGSIAIGCDRRHINTDCAAARFRRNPFNFKCAARTQVILLKNVSAVYLIQPNTIVFVLIVKRTRIGSVCKHRCSMHTISLWGSCGTDIDHQSVRRTGHVLAIECDVSFHHQKRSDIRREVPSCMTLLAGIIATRGACPVLILLVCDTTGVGQKCKRANGQERGHKGMLILHFL